MGKYDYFMEQIPDPIRQTVDRYICDEIVIFKPNTYITGKEMYSDDFHIIVPSSCPPETYFNGKKHNVERGKIIAINPGTTILCPEGRPTKKYISMLMKSEFIQKLMNKMEISGELKFENLQNPFSIELLQTIQFFDNETSRDEPSALLLDCLSMQIVALILREFETNLNKCSLEKCYTKRQSSDSYIKKAIDYMNAFYTSNISIDDICANIYVSPFHFMRTFKQKTGVSPHQYLMEIRIKKAIDLLKTRNHNTVEIANLCGYVSTSHFFSTFKASTGYTPTDYQKKHFIQ